MRSIAKAFSDISKTPYSILSCVRPPPHAVRPHRPPAGWETECRNRKPRYFLDGWVSRGAVALAACNFADL